MFGWKLEPGPTGSGSTISTPNLPGGMHGDDPGAAPYLFFKVDDLDAAADRVRELGGSVEQMDRGGDEATEATFGRFRFCRDDQGSPFGLHQPPSG